MQTGRVIKLLGGFYTVEAGGEIVETRARGNFRARGLKPVVGDFVNFENGYILSIHDRSNQLLRPAIANIDQAVVVLSTVTPDFSLNLLDRFLVLLEQREIQPLIIVTKLDLVASDEVRAYYKQLVEDYAKIGYQMLLDWRELLPFLKDKVTVFMGQTGVGKTTLLNKIEPTFDLEIGETSAKLGRGRHTTRHVELHKVAGGLIADTPGFSSLDYEVTTSSDLNAAFIEIDRISGNCKFRECTHTHEPNCAVKQAAAAGEILQSRYDNYLQLLSEIQKTREIYVKRRKNQQR